MFLEYERRHVWQITNTIDYRETNVGIILCHEFDNRSLREPDTDDEIVVAFSKGAHGRFYRGRIAGFDIAQHNRQGRLAATRSVGPGAGFRTLCARPGRGVE